MESRKVQQVGGSTLSVSLPKDWAREHGVGKGDVVLLEAASDGTLRLRPPAEAGVDGGEPPAYVVDADAHDAPGILARVVVGNYVLGRNRLRITSERRLPRSSLEAVRDAASKLLGMGVMAEDEQEIRLQVSLDPSRFPVETTLKRLYRLGDSMRRDAVAAILEGDPDLAATAAGREDEADQMYWLTIRLLLAAQRDGDLAEEVGLPGSLPIVGNRLVARSLEQVADAAEQAAAAAEPVAREGRLPEDLLDRVEALSEAAGGIVEDALSSLFHGEVELANDAIERTADVEEREDALMRAAYETVEDPEQVAALREVAASLRRVAEGGEEIALIGVNRYLETPSALCAPEEPDARP
jgi:phosphate uptake regulator